MDNKRRKEKERGGKHLPFNPATRQQGQGLEEGRKTEERTEKKRKKEQTEKHKDTQQSHQHFNSTAVLQQRAKQHTERITVTVENMYSRKRTK